MSYDIAVYRIETKEKYTTNDDEFFENEDNLVPFTDQQFAELKQRLLAYEYVIDKKDKDGIQFSHPDEDYGTVLLCSAAVYFTASWNGDSIFEVGLTASEFTDSGDYAKYDFQNGEWEEWE